MAYIDQKNDQNISIGTCNVIRTIKEMFGQRGYTILDDQPEPCVILAEKPNGEIVCFFKEICPKINKEQIQKYISYIGNKNIPHAVIVYVLDLTPAVKALIPTLDVVNVHIELFRSQDLQYNITKHSLVPAHRKLSKREAKKIKEKYKIKNLPKILRSEPIAKFYHFRIGDIIEITRKNNIIAYRVVGKK